MTVRPFSWLVVLTIILLGGGCASGGGGDRPPADLEPDDAGSTTVGAEGATTPLGKGEGFELDPLKNPTSPLTERIIYFDFDSSEVRPDVMELITTHGEYLADNPKQRVRLEGHADERGSREYNLGLGERRARAVNELLRLQGVIVDQVELISYGEELPAAFGHDEESWQINRRVEIVYLEQ